MSPFQQIPGRDNDMSEEDSGSQVSGRVSRETTRYFLMDGKCNWKEVSWRDYIDASPDNNKACVNCDGLVGISVASITQDSLEALYYVLRDGFNDIVVDRG